IPGMSKDIGDGATRKDGIILDCEYCLLGVIRRGDKLHACWGATCVPQRNITELPVGNHRMARVWAIAGKLSRPRGREVCVTHSRLFRLISILSLLIFWLSVESGTRKRSAASVWFHAHFSNISLITRRSQSSMMSNREASERCSNTGNVAPRPTMWSGNKSSPMVGPEESTTARSITFSNSRTFPGHE